MKMLKKLQRSFFYRTVLLYAGITLVAWVVSLCLGKDMTSEGYSIAAITYLVAQLAFSQCEIATLQQEKEARNDS